MQLFEYCRKAVDESLKLGAEAVDVYGVDIETIRVEVKKNNIEVSKASHDVGLGIRAIIRGSMGYSYAAGLNISVSDVAHKAVKAARIGYPDPDFKDLPRPSGYPSPQGIYDDKVASLTPEELSDLAKSLIKKVKMDKIHSVNIAIESSKFTCFVVNSNGVEGVDEGTYLSFLVYITARDGVNMSSSYDGDIVRMLKDIDMESMVLKTAQEAVKGLKARPYRTAKVPVILSGKVLLAVMVEGVASALNADLVQRGRSYMVTWINERIGVEALTIIDDGLVEGGPLTRRFDVEGTPRQRTTLIEGGFVKSLLHNSYTSGKARTRSTGNASRSGGPLDFRGQVTIAPSNVVIEPGDWSLEEMIEEVRDGLLILDTHDTPNIATGELSAMVTHGYIIENGEVKEPVKQTMFAFNLVTFLRNIRAIGRERSKHFNLYSPPILASEVQVSSKA
ncbi:MAG: TldD/PmbA family protein [Candidatus Nezhaarchaeales archaeon]